VAVTAPYFHNGQTEHLRDAILHAQPRSATPVDSSATTLTIGDVDDLAAFLAR